MSEQPDLLTGKAPTPPKFDGATYSAEHDGIRLHEGLQIVFDAMKDGQWWTLSRLANLVGCREQSASARVRDLRKVRNGGRTIERRRVIDGLWEYKMIL